MTPRLKKNGLNIHVILRFDGPMIYTKSVFKKFYIVLAALILLVFGFDFVLYKNLQNYQLVANLPDFSHFSQYEYESPKTTIILTGDIMLGRSVMRVSLNKNDPIYPFRNVMDVLNDADVVLGNLENPVIADCPISDSGFKFCADPRMIDGLKKSNISIVSLANNHTKNYGEDGLKETEDILSNNGISYVGMNNLVTKNMNGTNFGFLGFDFVDKRPSNSDYELIHNSKQKVDQLIAMVHWGVEYSSEPTEEQKLIAKNLISAGADVVVGSHPHWVQNIEFVDEKPVFYSLGNFVFDQPWSEETKKGLGIRLTYEEGKLLTIEKLPIYMRGLSQPEWSSTPEVVTQ